MSATTPTPKKPSMENDPPVPTTIRTKTIQFDNGRYAKLLHTPIGIESSKLWESLAIPNANALILLSGNAASLEPKVSLKLEQLFSRGIVRAAQESHAMILDSGIDAGAMSIVGRSLTDQNKDLALVGMVAADSINCPNDPNAKEGLDLEANHSHFILLPEDKPQAKLQTLFNLVIHLEKQMSVVNLVVCGDDGNKAEVLRSVRLGLPVILMEGSGGLADTIAQLYKETPEFIEDPILAEIIADGDLHPYSIKGSVSELERLILRQLRGDATLMLAWKQFAAYNANANRQQSDFRRLQSTVLYLGVLATLLVVLQSGLKEHKQQDKIYHYEQQWQQQVSEQTAVDDKVENRSTPRIQNRLESDTFIENIAFWHNMRSNVRQLYHRFLNLLFHLFPNLVELLGYVIISIPIMISILLTAANRFNAGTKWLILRSSAESIKREIFRYRAQAEVYSAEQSRKISREVRLAKKLQTIGSQLSQTEVNLSAFRPYEGKLPPKWTTADDDDGLTALNPERYLTVRLEDQLNYYINKTTKLESKFRNLQWGIYIIGGIGTLCAALGVELWIALTTSIVTALGTYLEYQQMEKTLTQYNQAAIDLTNVRSWWVSLSAAEQAQQSNIDMLVGQTERILQSEFSGWVQEMQDALNNLKEQQGEDDGYNADKEAKNATVRASTPVENKA